MEEKKQHQIDKQVFHRWPDTVGQFVLERYNDGCAKHKNRKIFIRRTRNEMTHPLNRLLFLTVSLNLFNEIWGVFYVVFYCGYLVTKINNIEPID